MINSKLFIAFLFLPLLFFQCRKEEKRTIVKVTVLDKTNNKPVENARVFLMGETFTSAGSSGPSSLGMVEEKRTNKLGECTFDFMANTAHTSYYCYCSADRYYDQDESEGGIESGCLNYVAIPMQPEAYLKVFVKNTQPFDMFDYIYVGPFGPPSEGGGAYYGVNVDTFSIARVYGNYLNNLMYDVNKNEIWSIFREKIYCPAFDTTFYTINY